VHSSSAAFLILGEVLDVSYIPQYFFLDAHEVGEYQ